MKIDQIPFDTLLEQQILGTMLIDPERIADIASILRPDDFYHQEHQLIYQELVRLWNNSIEKANFISLIPFLEKHGISVTKVHKWTKVINPEAVEELSRQLRLISVNRRLVQTGHEIASLGYLRDPEQLEEAISKAEEKIARITDPLVDGETLATMPEALDRFRDIFETACKSKSAVTGLPSGFVDLDSITTGFKEEFIVLAARPSMGKSAFAISMLLNMRLLGYKGAFFQLEMNEEQVLQRIIAAHSQIDSKKIRNGRVNEKEKRQVEEAIDRLQEDLEGLYLDTSPSLSVFEMKAKARKLKRKRQLDFLIVDYLQLLQAPGNSQYEIVTNISRQLKLLSRELNVPVISLCQLSRAVEMRQDKRPMLSDLRESGAIEQDADIVLFLHRDDYYNEDAEEKGIIEVIVAKNRNGALGTAKLLFKKETNTFLPITDREPPPLPRKDDADEQAATIEGSINWEEGWLD